MFVERIRCGRVVLEECNRDDWGDQDDEQLDRSWEGFHIDLVHRGSKHRSPRLPPESDAALIREIRRQFPEWTPPA